MNLAMSQFTCAEMADILGSHISRSVSYHKNKSNSPGKVLIGHFRQVPAISKETKPESHARFSLLWEDGQGWLNFLSGLEMQLIFIHCPDYWVKEQRETLNNCFRNTEQFISDTWKQSSGMLSFVKPDFSFSAFHLRTILAKIQAEVSSIHHGGVSANGPQIEVHVNRQRSESCNSKPGQHKDVCQHNKLQ